MPEIDHELTKHALHQVAVRKRATENVSAPRIPPATHTATLLWGKEEEGAVLTRGPSVRATPRCVE